MQIMRIMVIYFWIFIVIKASKIKREKNNLSKQEKFFGNQKTIFNNNVRFSIFNHTKQNNGEKKLNKNIFKNRSHVQEKKKRNERKKRENKQNKKKNENKKNGEKDEENENRQNKVNYNKELFLNYDYNALPTTSFYLYGDYFKIPQNSSSSVGLKIFDSESFKSWNKENPKENFKKLKLISNNTNDMKLIRFLKSGFDGNPTNQSKKEESQETKLKKMKKFILREISNLPKELIYDYNNYLNKEYGQGEEPSKNNFKKNYIYDQYDSQPSSFNQGVKNYDNYRSQMNKQDFDVNRDFYGYEDKENFKLKQRNKKVKTPKAHQKVPFYRPSQISQFPSLRRFFKERIKDEIEKNNMRKKIFAKNYKKAQANKKNIKKIKDYFLESKMNKKYFFSELKKVLQKLQKNSEEQENQMNFLKKILSNENPKQMEKEGEDSFYSISNQYYYENMKNPNERFNSNFREQQNKQNFKWNQMNQLQHNMKTFNHLQQVNNQNQQLKSLILKKLKQKQQQQNQVQELDPPLQIQQPNILQHKFYQQPNYNNPSNNNPIYNNPTNNNPANNNPANNNPSNNNPTNNNPTNNNPSNNNPTNNNPTNNNPANNNHFNKNPVNNNPTNNNQKKNDKLDFLKDYNRFKTIKPVLKKKLHHKHFYSTNPPRSKKSLIFYILIIFLLIIFVGIVVFMLNQFFCDFQATPVSKQSLNLY